MPKEQTAPTPKTKPQNAEEVIKYFQLMPRASARFCECFVDFKEVSELTWPTLRALTFAACDPKTTAKGLTKSKKVIMYRQYDKLWQSIVDAVRIYKSEINAIKVQPEQGESVADFRKRFLHAILKLDS